MHQQSHLTSCIRHINIIKHSLLSNQLLCLAFQSRVEQESLRMKAFSDPHLPATQNVYPWQLILLQLRFGLASQWWLSVLSSVLCFACFVSFVDFLTNLKISMGLQAAVMWIQLYISYISQGNDSYFWIGDDDQRRRKFTAEVWMSMFICS